MFLRSLRFGILYSSLLGEPWFDFEVWAEYSAGKLDEKRVASS